MDVAESLDVRHPGYDVRSVLVDPAVAFPTSLLETAADDGVIGRLVSPAYSFIGACSQGKLRRELDDWVDTWKTAGVEALFLVPV